MRLVIFGTGGVGGYFGGRLAQAGHDVVFIARGEHLRALRERGLQVQSVKGDFTLHPVQASDAPAQVAAAGGPAQVVILGVKTWQLAEAAAALRPLLGPGSAVLPLQNGVEAPEQLAAALGRQHVLAGIARIFSYLSGPGQVQHIGGPASLAFAELDNAPSQRVARLRAACAAAGIAVEEPADILAALWEKFLFVVPVGGVGAVTRAPVGVLRRVPETRRLVEQAMREILAVAQARGLALAPDVVERTLTFLDALPAGGTASLQRDIAAGRPSELAAWNGAVVRLGAQAGVPTPVNAFIYASLLPLEKRARGEEAF